MSKIGRFMRGWRQDLGLTQREAALRAGISQPSWCQYEAGDRIPRNFRVITALIRVTRNHQRFALRHSMFHVDAPRAKKSDQRLTGTAG